MEREGQRGREGAAGRQRLRRSRGSSTPARRGFRRIPHGSREPTARGPPARHGTNAAA